MSPTTAERRSRDCAWALRCWTGCLCWACRVQKAQRWQPSGVLKYSNVNRLCDRRPHCDTRYRQPRWFVFCPHRKLKTTSVVLRSVRCDFRTSSFAACRVQGCAFRHSRASHSPMHPLPARAENGLAGSTTPVRDC
jgi:hypothetical protein